MKIANHKLNNEDIARMKTASVPDDCPAEVAKAYRAGKCIAVPTYSKGVAAGCAATKDGYEVRRVRENGVTCGHALIKHVGMGCYKYVALRLN